jgi:hypothetical protein
MLLLSFSSLVCQVRLSRWNYVYLRRSLQTVSFNLTVQIVRSNSRSHCLFQNVPSNSSLKLAVETLSSNCMFKLYIHQVKMKLCIESLR